MSDATGSPPPEILAELARAVADLGPAIEPPGHRELLEWIVQTVCDVTGAAAASVAAFDPEHETLTFVAASGSAAEQIVEMEMDAGKGIAGWALSAGQSISITDASRDPRFAKDIAEATGYTPTTVFAIPLETETGVQGVMEVLDAPDDRIEAHNESRLVSTLARQAAVALETRRLFGDFGSVMFRAAAAAAAEDADLRSVLERIADGSRGPAGELTELLDLFAELGALGPKERKAATDLLYTFLVYAEGARD
jgi:GAF domain-containing protein